MNDIKIKSLSKSYQQSDRVIPVLKGVDLQIPPKASLSLMGRSGGGKSTLISLLAGLDQPDQGHIEIFGQDLGRLSPTQLNEFRAKNIGIIFQQFYLLDHLSALENVRLPLDLDGTPNAEDLARSWLKRVGLENREEHFPDQLSRGECQRVAIARGLIRKPKLVLADEPTGSLDVQTGEQIMKLIHSLQADEGFILLLVTHDPQHAAACRERYILREGQLQKLSGTDAVLHQGH